MEDAIGLRSPQERGASRTAPAEDGQRPFGSVLICTHNRARLLDGALASLAGNRPTFAWEVIIVDNCSADDTTDVVARHAKTFPAPLRYVHEGRLGKSRALNTGIATARGDIVIFGDDDQVFADDWVEQSCRAFAADGSIAYSGGPVLPLFGAPVPAWFDLARAEFRAPLGLFDYGTRSFIFEERERIPGGGNMAVRRDLFARAGGFREDLGRHGRSLLGQEQAEFFSRSRAAGARGLFMPGMRVWHHVPQDRLSRRYCALWWYWKGVGQARWHVTARRTENGLELGDVRRLWGIPRYLYGEGFRAVAQMARTCLRHSAPADRFLPVLRVAYIAGYVVELINARRKRPEMPRVAAAEPAQLAEQASHGCSVRTLDRY